MGRSNESVVTIRNAQSSNTGKYRCEVSGEAPDFETDYREAHMSVVGIKNSFLSFNFYSNYSSYLSWIGYIKQHKQGTIGAVSLPLYDHNQFNLTSRTNSLSLQYQIPDSPILKNR